MAVPGWDERGGPARLVERRVGREQGLVWRFTAEHVRAVWGAMRIIRGGARGRGRGADPLLFSTGVARHVRSCGMCSAEPGLSLWAVALRFVGGDVPQVIRLLGRN